MTGFAFKAGPVGSAFLADRHFVKLICGPVGGGKSTVCLIDQLQRSVAQVPFDNVRRTKHLIVRNTMPQLRQTVKPIIDQWFGTMVQNRLGAWRHTDNTFELKFRLPDDTRVSSEFIMMPADTPDDVRRLLSLEVSDAWLEECREIVQEIAEGVQGRTMRFPNRLSGGVTYPGVVCSTNPPPFGSYWQKLMQAPPDNMSVHVQPPALLDDGSVNPEAENLDNLHPDYYANLIQGKTDDWINVYLKNKHGSGGFGEPVFKSTFRAAFHVASEPLRPVLSSDNTPIVVGMDNGLTAAATIGQMDARGRLNILGECYVPDGQSMGVETFLDRLLIPYLRDHLPVRREHILFVLDPACYQRSQLNELTIAMAVQARGFRPMRASTNDPERRIGAVETLLQRAVDGGPGLLISPTCPYLVQALEYGYRNKKMANGTTTATPEKNHFSHIADSLQYLCLHYQLAVHPAAAQFRPRAPEIQRVAYRYV